MKENNDLIVTQDKSNNNKVVTQDVIRSMIPSELLQFLKQFEGTGRSQRFTDDAATAEKKKSGFAYKYDFSWSWLSKKAFNMGIEYGDGHWCMKSCETKPKESTYTVCVQKLDNTKKRTIEVDSDVWAKWDKMFGALPCKAVFYSAALNKFIEDMTAGKIKTTFDIV